MIAWVYEPKDEVSHSVLICKAKHDVRIGHLAMGHAVVLRKTISESGSLTSTTSELRSLPAIRVLVYHRLTFQVNDTM